MVVFQLYHIFRCILFLMVCLLKNIPDSQLELEAQTRHAVWKSSITGLFLDALLKFIFQYVLSAYFLAVLQ
jgi:hypothetical protein